MITLVFVFFFFSRVKWHLQIPSLLQPVFKNSNCYCLKLQRKVANPAFNNQQMVYTFAQNKIEIIIRLSK